MTDLHNKKEQTPLLDIRNLVVHYETEAGVVEAVNDISLTVEQGESVALVGETGAGKTTIALSIMKLLPVPPAHVVDGAVMLHGENVLEKPEKDMRKIRGSSVSMIFQDPMTALNPIIQVGDQIAEVISLHTKCSKAEAMKKALEMLETVGIRPERSTDYPHQFSGGMKQRVVIAMALACQPTLLIADEPTTALDVTIQAQVLEMINDLKVQFHTSMLLITHDLGIVAETCDDVAIMYAGEIVEYGSLEHIFDNPRHPYTKGLFGSIPSLEKDVRRLSPIRGMMPDPANLPEGCKFHDRCEYACEKCMKQAPDLKEVEPGHLVLCTRVHEGEI